MWGNLKVPGGVRFPRTAWSADALICVGDLENPVLGAKVTLKAENQILSLISVCFDILFELCNYYTYVTSACVLKNLWEAVKEKHVFQGESCRKAPDWGRLFYGITGGLEESSQEVFMCLWTP